MRGYDVALPKTREMSDIEHALRELEEHTAALVVHASRSRDLAKQAGMPEMYAELNAILSVLDEASERLQERLAPYRRYIRDRVPLSGTDPWEEGEV